MVSPETCPLQVVCVCVKTEYHTPRVTVLSTVVTISTTCCVIKDPRILANKMCLMRVTIRINSAPILQLHQLRLRLYIAPTHTHTWTPLPVSPLPQAQYNFVPYSFARPPNRPVLWTQIL